MVTRENNMPFLFFTNDLLIGEGVVKTYRHIGDLSGVFKEKEIFDSIPSHTLVYEVYSYMPLKEGVPGGLYFGITKIYPGKVGQEYYMTKGHFHAERNTAEYYWGIKGEGMLILMDSERNIWMERIFPGSLHYIPGGVAHRVANIGNETLSFAACWPSNAGHNYEEIALNGFSARLMDINGTPQLI